MAQENPLLGLDEPALKLGWASQETDSGETWLALKVRQTTEPGTRFPSGPLLLKRNIIPATSNDVVHVRLVDNLKTFADTYTVSTGDTFPIRLDVIEILCGQESVDLLRNNAGDKPLLAASAFIMINANEDPDETKRIVRNALGGAPSSS